MKSLNNYAALKTIDAEPIKEYTKENFDKLMDVLEYKTVEKSDRFLHFATKNTKVGGITIFATDYLEVIK